MKKYKNHLAIRWYNITLCGIKYEGKLPPFRQTFWADAVKVVRENPYYKNVNFCKSCLKLKKKKRIKQLTAEECRKA